MPPESAPALVEVVVELTPPAAAEAGFGQPGRERRAAAALRAIEAAQARFEARLADRVPGADVRWRYRVVLDGLAVALPAGELHRLEHLPGVVRVYPSVRYRPLLDRAGAGREASLPSRFRLASGGAGIKIGIIDDGIDQSHPFFDPAGFTMPPGFPKGRAASATAKVIVARAFPPPDSAWVYASAPFDPVYSFHGTHVAGIAAGNADAAAGLSGVAPLAYLGNYKALTTPTESGVGLNGNSPELVAAIEAAVADGMDVINLSLGEPELDPARDVVARALDGAAAAGVVPVVAAGNDFEELGRGSVGSPGSAPRAITVAATTDEREIAPFSASGPTPLGLEPKPDVSAPGVEILSSLPGGAFDVLSGTSMAAPHVSGAAALLRELNPGWTVEQVKSALVLTGDPVRAEAGGSGDVPSARQGGGFFDPGEAAAPLLFASPQSLGFGLVDPRRGPARVERTVTLTDAGGGAGAWRVSVSTQARAAGARVAAPAQVEVPGELTVTAAVDAGAAEGERTGFVVLERNGEVRRVPWWFRVARPRLGAIPARTVREPGLYRGNPARSPARVSSYRYPDRAGVARNRLPGPEQVFRLVLRRPAANLGVAVVHADRDVDVEPRIVLGADENRLGGVPALPFVSNPYLPTFRERTRSAAVLMPAAGVYSLVFDTPSRGKAGAFAFRLWIGDVTPPRVRLLSRTARAGVIAARVWDRGAGVDPGAVFYSLDAGPLHPGRYDPRRGLVLLDVGFAGRGRHRLLLRASDRQEAKNNENVARILPNTRTVTATITVP